MSGEILVLLEVPLFAPVANSGAQGVLVRRVVVMHEVIDFKLNHRFQAVIIILGKMELNQKMHMKI